MTPPIKKLSFFRKEKAQTLVEFALVFPVLLVITYGIIEFSRMVFTYAVVTGAAREGARYGAAAGGSYDNSVIPKFADCPNIREAVRKNAFLVSIPDASIQIWYDRPGSGTIANGCPPPISYGKYIIKPGDRVVVRISAKYTPVIKFLGISELNIIGENARTILVNVPLTK